MGLQMRGRKCGAAHTPPSWFEFQATATYIPGIPSSHADDSANYLYFLAIVKFMLRSSYELGIATPASY